MLLAIEHWTLDIVTIPRSTYGGADYQSKNCMIELRSSVKKQKPIIALMDPEKGKGGLTKEEVHAQLLEADDSYAKWSFEDDGPRGEELFVALFSTNYIEWSRMYPHVDSNSDSKPRHVGV